MTESAKVVRYPLVHIRGGPAMVLAALFGSLPIEAQRALRTFMLFIPVLTIAKVKQALLRRFIKRVLTPLFVSTVKDLTGLDAVLPKLDAASQTYMLVALLTQAILWYPQGKRLADMLQSLPATLSSAAPGGRLAALGDADLSDRLLSVVRQPVDTWVPSSLCSSATLSASPPRVSRAFFSTTTPLALRAFFRHMHARPGQLDPVTVYVPGLLTAPWTQHLVPLLLQAQRQHGTQVAGYDIALDAHRYDADLNHLRTLGEHHRQQRRGSSVGSAIAPPSFASGTAGPLSSPSVASSASCSNGVAVLILASIRGRRIRNSDEACAFAKMRGWHVIELCVPTIPEDAAASLETPECPLHRVNDTLSLTRPDVRLTAFDDVGMYGGAVMELCLSDASMLAQLASDCQPGLPDIAAVVNASATDETAAGALAKTSLPGTITRVTGRNTMTAASLRALSSSAVRATADVAARTNELLVQVWAPWARRLIAAAWREEQWIRQASVSAQEVWVAAKRFPTETLPMLPDLAQQTWRQWSPLNLPRLTGGRGRGEREKEGDAEGLPGLKSAAAAAVAASASVPAHGHSTEDTSQITADAPVEQRTTLIKAPLPPLDLIDAPMSSSSQPSQKMGAEESPVAALHTASGPSEKARSATAVARPLAVGAVKGAVSSLASFAWMSRRSPKSDPPADTQSDAPASPSSAPSYASAAFSTGTLSDAAGDAPNTAVEWRIRLRWSALLLAPFSPALQEETDSTFQSGIKKLQSLHSGGTDSMVLPAAAAYVSLWSFVARLPPWATAVSAADDVDGAAPRRRCYGSCVEASACALLLRVDYPAEPREVARLLEEATMAEARAVSLHTWARLAAASHASSTNHLELSFEDVLLMPGCTQAAQAGEELVYVPLSSALPCAVREAMLQVLWEKVPHAVVDLENRGRRNAKVSKKPSTGASPHVRATLHNIYRHYLPRVPAVEAVVAASDRTQKSGWTYSPLRNAFGQQMKGTGAVVSDDEARRVQAYLLDSAASVAAAAVSARAFLTTAAKALVQPLTANVAQALTPPAASKL